MAFDKTAYQRKYMRRYRAAKRRKRESGEREALQLDAPATPVPPGNIDDAIDWIQSTLRVPSGPLRGQPFRLDDWQCAFLKAALADGVQEAGLSVARKNGKTGLISALLLAYLCGPLTRADFRGLVTSLTGRLAQELRHACELTAQASGLPLTVMKSPTPGRIVGENGSQVDFLACDRSTGHSSGADLACIDEAGLCEESSRELWNAVFSSISGRAGRLLAISVRGRGPMFSELAARADDPSVVWHEYACSGNKVDLNDEAEWHRANPGLRCEGG